MIDLVDFPLGICGGNIVGRGGSASVVGCGVFDNWGWGPVENDVPANDNGIVLYPTRKKLIYSRLLMYCIMCVVGSRG